MEIELIFNLVEELLPTRECELDNLRAWWCSDSRPDFDFLSRSAEGSWEALKHQRSKSRVMRMMVGPMRQKAMSNDDRVIHSSTLSNEVRFMVKKDSIDIMTDRSE